jgi:hypothetical protein
MKLFVSLFSAIIFICGASGGIKKYSNFQQENNYPILIPEVQKFTPLKSSFKLPDSFSVKAPKGSTVELSVIKKALALRFPTISVVPEGNAICRLRITNQGVPKSDQGYILKIDQDGIVISARAPIGLFYGVQTLVNIIRNTGSRTLKGCIINDFPDLKLRGVFFNLRSLKSGQVEQFKKTIDSLAALKYNLLVLEFADNFPLKNNPFTKRKFTLSKKDVLSIVNYARERHLEIIPHLQLLTHTAWLLKHPDYIKTMQEGKLPRRTWLTAYCPSNPKVINLMFKVLSESIALLKPKYYHICFDELNFCTWQVCKKCKARDSVELLTEHVKLMESKVFELGAIPVLYQDTFYKGYKGEKVLEKLDRRDVIAFWRYNEYPSPKRLHYYSRYGFPILGVTYCKNIANNVNMPKLIAANKGLGCYLTYWGYAQGYLQQPERANKNAYVGTIIAANYFWKANGVPLEEIVYDPAYQMRRLIDQRTPERRGGNRVVSIPIFRKFNVKLGSDSRFPIFSSDKNLKEIKKLLAESPEKFNLVITPDGKYYGIVLANNRKDNSLPKKVEIPLEVKTDKLSFLITASRSNNMAFLTQDPKKIREKSHIGDIKLNFTDGSSLTIPLMYRLNVLNWNNDWGAYGMRLAMSAEDDKNSRCSFCIIDFDNPQPGKTIKSLTFSSNCKDAVTPVLLAVSAFDANSSFKASSDKRGLTAVSEYKVPTVKNKIFADFTAGLGSAKISTHHKFISAPRYEVIKDMTAPVPGNVLKIKIPPAESSVTPGGRTVEYGRIIVDVAIPAKSADQVFCFDYKTDHPEYIYKSGAYVGNSKYSKYRGMFNFHSPTSINWESIRFPVNKMVIEGKSCKLGEIVNLRVSFWVTNPTEMTIWLDNVGVSKTKVYYCPAFRKVYKNKK